MKVSGTLLSAFGLVAFSNAAYYANVTTSSEAAYETYVVTDVLTTYCPEPTVVEYAPGKKITVTKATTLTIYDCPCTLSKPAKTYHTVPSPSGPTPSKEPEYPEGEDDNPEEPEYITTVVSEYITYCSTPTSWTHGTETYVVTEPKTVTVTQCGGPGEGGCTISFVPPQTTQPPPTTKYVTITYGGDTPSVVTTYTIITPSAPVYSQIPPPVYAPSTVVVTITATSGEIKYPVVTTSIYLPPPPVVCYGCATVPVYIQPTPSTPVAGYSPPVVVTVPIYVVVPTSTPAAVYPPASIPPSAVYTPASSPSASIPPPAVYTPASSPPASSPPASIPPPAVYSPASSPSAFIPPPAVYTPASSPSASIPPPAVYTPASSPPSVYTPVVSPPTGNSPGYSSDNVSPTPVPELPVYPPAGCSGPSCPPPVSPPTESPPYSSDEVSPTSVPEPPVSPPSGCSGPGCPGYENPPTQNPAVSSPPAVVPPAGYAPTTTAPGGPAYYTGAANVERGLGMGALGGLVIAVLI